ncbi:ubiquitin-related domain-containing protein, partial [Ochromonadaceae sp. CCMP2298]
MSVVIKTIDNQMHSLLAEGETLVSSLKQSIREVTSVSVDRQRLIYRGRVLADESTLSEYGIEGGHIVHMVVR